MRKLFWYSESVKQSHKAVLEVFGGKEGTSPITKIRGVEFTHTTEVGEGDLYDDSTLVGVGDVSEIEGDYLE